MASELRDGVWHLDLGYVNAYLVDDEGTLTLIDAGTPRGTEKLREEINATGHDESNIDRILITHFDPDHVGALAELNTEAPIYAREPDASYIEGTKKPSFLNRKGFLHRIGNLFLTRPERPVQRIEDNDTIGGFVVHHTPGHTEGHVAFYHEGHDAVFAGDLIGNSGSLGLPPRIMTKDPAEDAESIKLLVKALPKASMLCMGHGSPISDGAAEMLEQFVTDTLS